mmetsp:Transcript_27531/g.41658  ORF Transcript_27531/g.41658 Transcript_27531/m.41658 type:complete len:148 (-) Transcript_27531:276-719(-)
MGCHHSSEIKKSYYQEQYRNYSATFDACPVSDALENKTKQSNNNIFGECTPCDRCQTLGGFDQSGNPARMTSLHYDIGCEICGGKGFIIPFPDKKKKNLKKTKRLSVIHETPSSAFITSIDTPCIKSSLSSTVSTDSYCSIASSPKA